MTYPAYTYSAQIIRWVDGDTLDVALDVGFDITINTRLRLYGIDTPERGRQGYAQATIRAAQLAPMGEWVTVRTYKAREKYGRYLARVITDAGVDVTDALIIEGLGIPYSGGTR